MLPGEPSRSIRRLAGAGLLAATLVASVGCSHTGKSESVATSTSRSASARPTPTSLAPETVTHLPPSAPPPPAPMQLDKNTWNSFGHFLLGQGGVLMTGDFSLGYSPLSSDHVSTGVKLLHPKYGQMDISNDVLAPKATFPTGKVTGVLVASSGSVDAPYLAGIVTVTEPSHDLEPASTVEYAVKIDPVTKAVVKKAEVGRHPDGTPYQAIDRLVGSPGDVIAWSAKRCNRGVRLVDDEANLDPPGNHQQSGVRFWRHSDPHPSCLRNVFHR